MGEAEVLTAPDGSARCSLLIRNRRRPLGVSARRVGLRRFRPRDNLLLVCGQRRGEHLDPTLAARQAARAVLDRNPARLRSDAQTAARAVQEWRGAPARRRIVSARHQRHALDCTRKANASTTSSMVVRGNTGPWMRRRTRSRDSGVLGDVRCGGARCLRSVVDPRRARRARFDRHCYLWLTGVGATVSRPGGADELPAGESSRECPPGPWAVERTTSA